MSGLSPAEALEAHLAWSDGAWLGFVFAHGEDDVRALRRRVPGPDGQQAFRPATPQQLREGVPRLLEGPGAPLTWVLACAVEPTPPWWEALDWFLMRANERRQPLLDHLGGGLLLVLPEAYRSRAPQAAPDLWSVRALVLDLPARPAAPPADPPPVERRIDVLLRRLAFQQRMRSDPWHVRVRVRGPAHRARVGERVVAELPTLRVRSDGDDLWIGVPPGEPSPSLDVDLDEPLPPDADGPEIPEVPTALDDPLAEVDGLLRTAAATWSQGWASETLELAERSLCILDELSPVGPDADRRRATALELAARSRRELGDAVGALDDLSRAVPARRRLAGLHGDDGPQRRRELARVLSLRGQLLLEGPDPHRSRTDLEEALALRKELVAWSDDPESLAELALSHSLLADALGMREPPDLPAVETACRSALALRRRVVQLADAPRHRRQLGLAWGRLGRILARQLHLAEAERAWTEAVAEAERVARGSSLPVHLVEESVARTQLASVRWQRGDREGARTEVERAIAQRRQLLADDPANARWAERLAVALGQAAQQALDEGDGPRALAWAEEAVEVGEPLAASTPSQLRGLALAHLRLGDVHASRGAIAEAERCWGDAEALLPALAARSPARAAQLRDALALRRG